MDEISPIKKVTISAKHHFVEPWMARGLEISSKKKHDLYKASITHNAMDIDRERYILHITTTSIRQKEPCVSTIIPPG